MFSMQWILPADEHAWLLMLEERNLTSHTYDELFAQKVYSRLPEHLKYLEALAALIEKQLI